MGKIKKIVSSPIYSLGRFFYYHLPAILPDEWYLRVAWRVNMGYPLDLKHPQSFNEKLQWLKLHDRRPEYIQMVDKLQAKELVANKIGQQYIIPTLAVFDSVDAIDPDTLPNQFVLKCNHDSGSSIICKDKSAFGFNNIKQQLKSALKHNYYRDSREWPYKAVKPKVFAEAYMEDEYGELRDYKFFCFNGVVKALFVATNRAGRGETYFDFYDDNYTHLPVIQGHPNAKTPPKKPKGFETMKQLAAHLSEGIPEVRIDFYDVNGKVYFGEFTFFHFSGNVSFNPPEWDYTLGNWIDLENHLS